MGVCTFVLPMPGVMGSSPGDTGQNSSKSFEVRWNLLDMHINTNLARTA